MLAEENNISMLDSDYKMVILGLGKSGVSVARFLRARGLPFIAVDTRQSPPDVDALKNLIPIDWMRFGDVDQSILNSVDTIILSPGLALSLPYVREAIDNGVDVIGDIELFARYADAPIVAITGSNGKTTVTSLLGKMAENAGLNVQVGGNIGIPALDLLTTHKTEQKSTSVDYYLLELSSFQLETTQALNASIVTILNISPDHMDRYAGIDQYANAKYRIYQGAHAVIVNKQEFSRWGKQYLPSDQSVSHPDCRMIEYGIDEPAVGQFGIKSNGQERCIYFGANDILPLSKLKLLGSHNHQNVIAALALGYEMGIAIESMLATIVDYVGLEHRTEWVACQNDVVWINDSKGTNIGATIAALSGLPGNKILIAGGVGKGADFGELRGAVTASDVSLVILFGRDASIIHDELQANVKTLIVNDLQAAIQNANVHSKPGCIVLFSPACASFDMFNNYEERGNTFKRIVKETLQCS